jgi:hypothetical protein
MHHKQKGRKAPVMDDSDQSDVQVETELDQRGK